MKNNWLWTKNDNDSRVNDEGCWVQAVNSFCDWLIDGQTNICECRDSFATANGQYVSPSRAMSHINTMNKFINIYNENIYKINE